MTVHRPPPEALNAGVYDTFLYRQYQQHLIPEARRLGLQSNVYGPLAACFTNPLDALHSVCHSQTSSPSDSAQEFIRLLRQLPARRQTELPLPLVCAPERQHRLSSLLHYVYPSVMHTAADPGRLGLILGEESAYEYSFMVLGGSTSDVRYLAACVGYVGPSLVDPTFPPVTRLEDIAVMPEGRAQGLGIAVFREFLVRALINGDSAIELRARRRTAYRAFRNTPLMRRIIESMGYYAADHGPIEKHGTGIHAEASHLIRLTRKNVSF